MPPHRRKTFHRCCRPSKRSSADVSVDIRKKKTGCEGGAAAAGGIGARPHMPHRRRRASSDDRPHPPHALHVRFFKKGTAWCRLMAAVVGWRLAGAVRYNELVYKACLNIYKHPLPNIWQTQGQMSLPWVPHHSKRRRNLWCPINCGPRILWASISMHLGRSYEQVVQSAVWIGTRWYE